MRILMATVLTVLLCFEWAAAQSEERADTTFNLGSGWVLELDPNDQPYPDYLADPRRPQMQLGVSVTDSDIPETSSGRIMCDLGTRYTLFKVSPTKEGKNEFALDVEGCLFTQFDPGNNLDNIGWDGRYGIFGVWDWSDKVVARVGYRHISAHLGDEYIEETGRQRIGYTRDDLAFGMGIYLNQELFIYVEPSWAWSLGNDDRQKRWAAEGGLQYQGPHDLWNNSTAFYAAAHVRAFDETSWEPGVSLQAGFHVTRDQNSSNLRIGLDAYTGRAILGEFALDYDESYLTLGIFFDFY
ncbi:DUF1207 domain-containing protein [Desulfoluna spongiiphila]|uniref:DUF1207 domain-containing protein n=1 Tax=Desulfoluna spongiiphila TaxID=419481 RepID=A0A1G5JB10_9BACT|nr:DUF1207 domain-containing protein [Desulfoluna spongiiphila]SCY85502.1 Protein of unknown function [Desulfoluna spongiiphila]VVS94217.1 protein of unknown function duf1207 [Desulfoluna spongiiphila]